MLILVGGTPIEASWLVLRDGKALETTGPWAIGDNRVTYTQPDGKQVKIMLVVVDPDATLVANVPGAPPPNPASGRDPHHKRMVINNDTLKRNRNANGSRESPRNQVDIGQILATIADCVARYPNDEAGYNRCSHRAATP
jgi:hypothetical protein